jgi:dihydrofolate synthase/folylpolyglutamate synthase
VELALRGAHQAENAGVAVGLVHAIAHRFADRELRRALPAGLAGASWPGRLERIPTERALVIVDAAHNPEGIDALRRAVTSPAERTALVFGALGDKRWPEMLRALAPVASRRYYTRPKGREAASPQALAGIVPGITIDEPRDALERALEDSTPTDTVLVAGSIYLVGELRAWLLGIEADPVIAL